MAFDATKKDLVIAVIGTGTMGRGIVQVSASGGMHVIAYDEKPGGAAAAKEFVGKMLDRGISMNAINHFRARDVIPDVRSGELRSAPDDRRRVLLPEVVREVLAPIGRYVVFDDARHAIGQRRYRVEGH